MRVYYKPSIKIGFSLVKFIILLVFLLSIASFKTALASTLFFDNFTDTDYTPLSNHNPLWQGYSGLDSGIIKNNMAKSNGSNSAYYIPSLINLTDYCVQVSFNYPLPHPDFLEISTRRSPSRIIGHYDAGINDLNSYYIDRDYVNSLFSEPADLSNGTHTLKLCSVGPHHSLYIDDSLIVTVFDNTYSSGAPGFDLGNNTPIDNFLVTSAEQDLNVPLVIQTDSQWKNETYDTANTWSPKDPTINSWGCALTSAVMVLNYYNITNMPDNTSQNVNPKTLNTWLKNQPDGYIGNGLVNWLAIARFSKLAAPFNQLFNNKYHALEYTRTSGADKNKLTTDLQNNEPDILEQPGHFIVAKGINGTTFDINDPYYARISLADYNNTFLSLGNYHPSNTNLSYIMLAIDPTIAISGKDSLGNSVGSSFLQNPLTSDPAGTTSGQALNTFYLPKPTSGTYTINLSSSITKLYSFYTYLYDKDGTVKPELHSGIVGPGKSDTISINFDPADLTDSSTAKTVTIQSMINDVKLLASTNDIKKGASVTGILLVLQNAQKENSKKKPMSSIIETELKTLPNLLKSLHGITVDDTAYGILTYDTNYLLNIYK